MTTRRERTYGNGLSPVVADILQLVFGLELLDPSRIVWLVSPWVGDIPVLDNRSGAFTAVGPGWPLRTVTMSEALGACVERGATVTLVTREEPANTAFLQAFDRIGARFPGRCRAVYDPKVHEKALVTSHAYVSGSMNFTFSGQMANRELIELETDPAEVNRALLQLASRYPDGGEAQ